MEEEKPIKVCPTCNKIDCSDHKTLEVMATDLMRILQWKIVNSTNED